MTVYVLTVYENGDKSFVAGVYADRSMAEAVGENLLRQRSGLYSRYTVGQEVVTGHRYQTAP